MYRINGEPEVEYEAVFPDVKEDDWFADAVIWAYKNGIISGYNDGRFGSYDVVVREHMAIMMHNYAKAKGFDISVSADLNKFIDASNVSGYAKEAMQWTVGKGIISGKENGTRLDPLEPTARAECASIIKSFMENI